MVQSNKWRPYPRIKTTNSTLKVDIGPHISQTRNQLDRIEKVFSSLKRNWHGEENVVNLR